MSSNLPVANIVEYRAFLLPNTGLVYSTADKSSFEASSSTILYGTANLAIDGLISDHVTEGNRMFHSTGETHNEKLP